MRPTDLLCSLALAALVPPRQEAGEQVRLHALLAATRPGATSGTFTAAGAVTDSGTTRTIDRFPAPDRSARAPLVVDGAEAFEGAQGTIRIAYTGVFAPASEGVFEGRGTWHTTGGTGAYRRLHAAGEWTGHVVYGSAGGLTVNAVYTGEAETGAGVSAA